MLAQDVHRVRPAVAIATRRAMDFYVTPSAVMWLFQRRMLYMPSPVPSVSFDRYRCLLHKEELWPGDGECTGLLL